jgi:hypothetical protein
VLTEELATLAGTSATTLVAAMTTSAWQSVRSGVARLYSHDGESRQNAAEIQLDTNAELVGRAHNPDRARQNLVGLWTLELERLLEQHPSTAGDLRALMVQAQAALPLAQQSWVQTIVARGGLSIGVQGGNVVMHGTTWQNASPRNQSSNDSGVAGN